jgi:hypothetical protein
VQFSLNQISGKRICQTSQYLDIFLVHSAVISVHVNEHNAETWVHSYYFAALLVGGSRDRSPLTGDFFRDHQTVPCALRSTQPLKMSTRIFLGVKTAGA